MRACDSRPFSRQLPGMAWSGWRARQLSKTSSFVNKKEIRAAGNENKPEREGGRHYTVQAGLSKYGGGSMCCFSDSANGCCCLIDTQHWGELKPFKLGWLGWGRYPIHRIWKMYWVRLYGFYVVERFSAHFPENCSEADNGAAEGNSKPCKPFSPTQYVKLALKRKCLVILERFWAKSHSKITEIQSSTNKQALGCVIPCPGRR